MFICLLFDPFVWVLPLSILRMVLSILQDGLAMCLFLSPCSICVSSSLSILRMVLSILQDGLTKCLFLGPLIHLSEFLPTPFQEWSWVSSSPLGIIMVSPSPSVSIVFFALYEDLDVCFSFRFLLISLFGLPGQQSPQLSRLINIIILFLWVFFTSALSKCGLPQGFERQQVSSSLKDSPQYSDRSQQCCNLDSLHSFPNFQVP